MLVTDGEEDEFGRHIRIMLVSAEEKEIREEESQRRRNEVVCAPFCIPLHSF